MDYKIVLTGIGIVIGLVSYGFYFYGIYRGKTKPHVFTWFVWTILNGIVFFAQIYKGGGFGSWIVGVNALSCLAVTIAAIIYGEKHITRADWFSFFGALSGIALWLITKNPLLAVILSSVVDIFAIIPTFRKSYYKPQEENALAFTFDTIKFALSLFALKSFNLTTVFYPASVVLIDSVLVLMILIRRKKLNPNP